jgi:hypothetical protein
MPDLLKEHEATIEHYKTFAKMMRLTWQGIPTPTGRPKFGPTFIAVTWCAYEGEVGVTNTGRGVGRRWTCKTCFNFVTPIWSDGKCPSTEEALVEYGEWASKQTNATKPWRKDMNGNDIK